MSSAGSLPPGFRFHPTDVELLLHYLRNRASCSPCPVSIIAEVDIYKYDPWELPAKAAYGDREWYFFSPRDRKYPNGFRPNRSAASGYWKATGTDKPIYASEGEGKNEVIGVKKALVFYRGKPPRGAKTNWIMHEYRLVEAQSDNSYRPLRPSTDSSMRLDDWVLCRIYKKNSHIRGPAMEEEVGQDMTDTNSSILNNNMKQQLAPRLQKSVSISDFLEDFSFLNQLLDNSPEMMLPVANSSSPVGQTGLAQLFANNSAMIHGSNNIEPSALVADDSMKRQRMVESYSDCSTSCNGFLHPLKRQNCGGNVHSSFSQVQMDSNLLDQQFLSQQLLLSSHLGFH